jgi:hypothetical protein
MLPLLFIGPSGLILFHSPPCGTNFEQMSEMLLGMRITYVKPALMLAHFTVACVFPVRMLGVTFGQIVP